MCFHLVFSFCVELLGMVEIMQKSYKLKRIDQSMHRRAFQHSTHAGRASAKGKAAHHAGKQRGELRGQRARHSTRAGGRARTCGAMREAAHIARARCGRDAGDAQAVRGIMRANAGQHAASAGVVEVASEEEKMGRRRKKLAEGKESEEHSRNPEIHAYVRL